MTRSDELNAVRYVSGYVPHVLLKKYEKMEERVTPYLACIGQWLEMRVASITTSLSGVRKSIEKAYFLLMIQFVFHGS